MTNYDALKARLAEIIHLNRAGAVLGWDQQCYMPAGGAGERAEGLAVISKISHEMLTGDETRRLLEAAESEVTGFDADSDEAAMLRVIRHDFDQSAKLPTALVAELSRQQALGHEIWVEARKESDWTKFAPALETILGLSRQVAEHLGYDDQPYDALLDQYEPGMKTRDVERVFGELRPGLVELVQALGNVPQIDDTVLRRDFDEAGQLAFGEKVIRKLGFDFENGRQDRAVHPFCTSFGREDVRITTRFDRNWLPMALMGTIHETGHALYEQGFDPKDDATVLGDAASLGFHESQSRLWENIIGRSLPFWNVFYGDLQKQFAGVLDDVPVNDFYRAINRVEPSLIRVEADEVTYSLHIMLRFELEKALVDGRLAIADVPAAWNEKMRDYLGITPPNDAEGCLQDVHWSGGMFGYFPTYALGTMLSAQLYDKAILDNPAIPTDLAAGEYGSLLGWLREKVHRPGRRLMPAELVERICGEPAQSRSYLKYLNEKFRAVYGIA